MSVRFRFHGMAWKNEREQDAKLTAVIRIADRIASQQIIYSN